MAITGETPSLRLACGRNPAVVWDQAAAGKLDPHHADCAYCQAVAADQAALQALVGELSTEPLDIPPRLIEQVMSVVRTELHRDYLPLPARHGPARLQHGPAAAVLRHAVDQMPGLRARSCRITPAGEADEPPGNSPQAAHPSAGAQVAPAVVRLSVAVQFGIDLPSAAARARQMTFAAADELLGLPVSRVDIDVVDVFEAPAADSAEGTD